MIFIKRSFCVSPEQRKVNGVLKTENLPIRIRVSYMGIRVDLFTGIRVDLKSWDKNKSMIKKGQMSADGLHTSDQANDIIHSQINAINMLFIELEESRFDINATEIKNSIIIRHKATMKEEGKLALHDGRASVIDTIDDFIAYGKATKGWKDAVAEKFKALKRRLKEFKPDLTFRDLTEVNLNKFVTYLMETSQLKNSTISKNIDHLKWYLGWCDKKRYLTCRDYKDFHPRLVDAPTPIITLDFVELKKIMELKLTDEQSHLSIARDFFLFQCFTGMRYSDAKALKKNDIKDGKIEIVTIKTTSRIVVELNNMAVSILAKYYNLSGSAILPKITDQRLNIYIKELGKRAGIDTPITKVCIRNGERIETEYPKWQLLSSHTGRRSFISNSLALGIPPNVVMEWTGHWSYKSMQPYIEIADRARRMHMDKYDVLDEINTVMSKMDENREYGCNFGYEIS